MQKKKLKKKRRRNIIKSEFEMTFAVKRSAFVLIR